MQKAGFKKLILISLLVLIAVSLVACSSQKPQNTAEEQTGFKPKFDTQTKATVKVVGHYNNFEALEAEFNRFNEYYPNVELSYSYLNNYSGIILTSLNGNDAPDIFFVYPWMVTTPDNRDLMQAAEDLSDQSLGIDLSCIRESVIIKDTDGRLPMIPIYSTTVGMMVNDSIFEKEKISIPKTYDELVSACEALQKAGYSYPVMGYNSTSLLLFPLYYPYFNSQLFGNSSALTDLNEMKPGAGEHARKALDLVSDFAGRGFIDTEACSALENDYNAVIMRFFEGDIPMMMASGGTVSGTEKRESQSEAFSANPFKYSFRPVPSTEKGGYFLESVSIGFGVNKNSKNLDMANEFMRFLISAEELNRMARNKRMVTPSKDIFPDDIYASFGELPAEHVISQSELGLDETPDAQVRLAAWLIANGKLTVDEAISSFGDITNE